MPKRDDDFALLLAGAVLGAGAAWLAASAYQANEKRQTEFFAVLARAMEERGFQLVTANFGRAAGNLAIWSVTYLTPWSETRLQRVRLEAGTEPYADSAAHQVAAALA